MKLAKRQLKSLCGSSVLQGLLHAGPADACAFLGRGRAMPVVFKADRVSKTGLFERAELRPPVDDTLADGRPFDLACRILYCVFDVAMVDSVFGQRFPGC